MSVSVKLRLLVAIAGLSANVCLSVTSFAQSNSECEKRAAEVYKDNWEQRYYVGVIFSSPLTGLEKAVSEFYKKAFNDARFWSITSCGFYVNANDVSRIANFQPPACDKNWGSDRDLFLRSAVFQSRKEFDELVHQTCKLEAADFRMTKFGLILVNPQPSIMFGSPSKSNK